MMAITTNSSTSVKPRRDIFGGQVDVHSVGVPRILTKYFDLSNTLFEHTKIIARSLKATGF